MVLPFIPGENDWDVTVRATLRPPELRSIVGLVEGPEECFALLGEIYRFV